MGREAPTFFPYCFSPELPHPPRARAPHFHLSCRTGATTIPRAQAPHPTPPDLRHLDCRRPEDRAPQLPPELQHPCRRCREWEGGGASEGGEEAETEEASLSPFACAALPAIEFVSLPKLPATPSCSYHKLSAPASGLVRSTPTPGSLSPCVGPVVLCREASPPEGLEGDDDARRT